MLNYEKNYFFLTIMLALLFSTRSNSAAEIHGIISQSEEATIEYLPPAQSYAINSPKEVSNEKFEWETLSASLPGARYGHVVVSEKGRFYSIGGETGSGVLREFLEFDPRKNIWRKLPVLPVGQKLASGAVVDGKIYVFGSYGPSNIVQIYDISKGVWSEGPPLPVPSYWHTAQAVGKKIYVIGGYPSRQHERVDRAVYILDTETNIWRKGKDIPVAMQIPTSAVYGTDIYVFYTERAYRYDTVADRWEPIPHPPASLGDSSEAVTYGNKIFILGGNKGYIYEAYRGVAIYDIAARKWATGPSMKLGRYQFGTAVLNEKIYAIGGRNEKAKAIADVEYLHVDEELAEIPLGLYLKRYVREFADETLRRNLSRTQTTDRELDRCSYTFGELDAPSVLTTDPYIPFDNYYNTFAFVRASEHALLLGLSDRITRDKGFYIANLKDGKLTPLPVELLSTSPYTIIPEANLYEEGEKINIVSSYIEGISESKVSVRLVHVQFDLSSNVIITVRQDTLAISVEDPHRYLKEVEKKSPYLNYWTDGKRFAVSYRREYEDNAPLQIVFGLRGSAVHKVEIAAPEDAALKEIYMEDYLNFCGYQVENGGLYGGKFVFGLEFYSGEGCRGTGGIGVLNFEEGTLEIKKPEALKQFSVEKIFALGKDALLVIPVWGGEGWAGRWVGPWVYYPSKEEWLIFPNVGEHEVLLDADVHGKDLWIAGDRKLYRFNFSADEHRTIYTLSKGEKSLVPVNSKTITKALSGTEEERKWGMFWLSENPPSDLTYLVLEKLDSPESRDKALRAVGRGKIKEALPGLLNMKMESSLALYHIFALYSLGGIEAREKIESLCREELYYCESAVKALSCMPEGTAALIRLLDINEPAVATSIVYNFGEMDATEAVPELLRFVEVVKYLKATETSEKAPAYRWQYTYENVIETFGRLKDRRAVPWLKKEMENVPDFDYEIKNEILDAIVSILGDETVKYLREIHKREWHPKMTQRIEELLMQLNKNEPH